MDQSERTLDGCSGDGRIVTHSFPKRRRDIGKPQKHAGGCSSAGRAPESHFCVSLAISATSALLSHPNSASRRIAYQILGIGTVL